MLKNGHRLQIEIYRLKNFTFRKIFAERSMVCLNIFPHASWDPGTIFAVGQMPFAVQDTGIAYLRL